MTTLQRWRTEFLRSRDLLVPTGDPLYTLQLDDNEYESLREILTDEINRLDILWPENDWIEINLLQRYSPALPSLFVLFASSWWSRYYGGSHFKYDPIFDALSTNSINSNDLTKIVEHGFRYWKISIDKSRGMAYLREIAINAGIPIAALEEGRGGVADLIQKVSIDAAKFNLSINEIREEVSSQLARTGKDSSYSRIAEVVTRFIDVMVEFRREVAGEINSVTADNLALLASTRDRKFPIYLGSEQAKRFVSSLAKQMSTPSQVQRTRTPSVVMELFVGRRNRIEAYLEFPSQVTFDDICHWSNMTKPDSEPAPDYFEVLVKNGSFASSFAIQRSIGQATYKFDQFKTIQLGSGNDLFEPVEISFVSPKAAYEVTPSISSVPLDRDLPWIFNLDDDGFRFIGNGTASTPSPRAKVVFDASDCKLTTAEGSEIAPIGPAPQIQLGDQWRSIVEVSSEAHFQNKYGSGTIKVRQEKLRSLQRVTWQPRNTIDTSFLSPSLPIFVSKPGASLIDDKSTESLSVHEIKKDGSNHSTLVAADQNRDIVATKRAIVLPRDAKIEIDSNNATLKLTNWNIEKVAIDKSRFSVAVDHSSVTFTMVDELDSKSNQVTTPCQITLRDNHHSFEMKIPNLRSSAYFLLASDKEIAGETEALTIFDFIGAKLRLLLPKPRSVSRVSVKAIYKDQRESSGLLLEEQIDFNTSHPATEQSLALFASRLRPILFGINHPDPTVVIEVQVDNRKVLGISVQRYKTRLDEVDTNTFRIFASDGKSPPAQVQERTSIRSICMLEPTVVVDFKYYPDEDVWRYDGGEVPSSTYFIFENDGGEVKLRPRIHQRNGVDLEDPSEFGVALNTADRNMRQKALVQVIRGRNEDRQNFWKVFGALTSEVAHLAAYNFDFWECTAQETALVAEILLDPFSRLDLQDAKRIFAELDFNPSLVSRSDWLGAIDTWIDVLEESGLQDKKVIETLICDRATKVGEAFSYLNSYIQILISLRFETNMNLFKIAFDRASIQLGKAFTDEDGPLQDLLRRRAGEPNWPVDLEDKLARPRLPRELQGYLWGRSSGYLLPVINFPIILAYLTLNDFASTKTYLLKNLREVSKYYQFDRTYFETLFEIAVEFFTLKDGYIK